MYIYRCMHLCMDGIKLSLWHWKYALKNFLAIFLIKNFHYATYVHTYVSGIYVTVFTKGGLVCMVLYSYLIDEPHM